MGYFHSIKDSDLFDLPTPEPNSYTDRPTAKGLVFDGDGKIALLCHPEEDYGLLPGGGIEEGETPEEAFERECREEIGCDVEILSKIGVAIQYRSRSARKYVVHFFVARVVGEKGEPSTTQEDEIFTRLKWLTESELYEKLKKQTDFKSPEWYQRQFNSHSHFAALEKYLKERN